MPLSALAAIAWVAAHLPLVLGYLLLLAAPAAWLLWRSAFARAAARAADVRVARAPPGDLDGSSGFDRAASPILDYLEVDDVFAAELCPGMAVTSLGRYMASLRPTGTVSLQGIIVSAMERYGLRIALPLALFAPAAWRRNNGVGGALAGTPYMALLAGNILSTLTLISTSALARWQYGETRKLKEQAGQRGGAAAEDQNGAAAAGKPGKPRPMNALQMMVAGGAVGKSDAALSAALASPCALPGGLAAAAGVDLDAYDPGAPGGPAPAPSPIHPLFPDLCSGNGGARMVCSPAQARVNDAMAVVANRLAGNALMGLGASVHEPTERYVVTLPAAGGGVGAEEFDSVEGLVAGLEARGHTVEVSIDSNVTSFGAGLSVREGGGDEWTQIPLAYPLATGLYAADEEGKPVEVVTLMLHAALYLRVSGPMLTTQLEWCLNVKGVTGWTPLNGIDRPWACDPRAVVYHAAGELGGAAGRRRALRLATASAAVLNCAATEAGLMVGGYGALGVCIDSVAAIEACLTGGACSLYPLTLGGDAKMGLLMAYDAIEGFGARRDGGRWAYGEEAAALRAAVATLPCDGLVEPTAAAATARRAMAWPPERSVFKSVSRCRAALAAAAAVADRVCPPNTAPA